MKGLDHYTIHARLMPVLITLFPLGLAFASVFPERFIGWGLLTGAISTFGLVSLLAQLGRDLGQKVQPKLFKAWGGKPTTIALCPERTWLNKIMILQIHALLSAEGTNQDLPKTRTEECADDKLDAAIAWVKEKTRDKDKFSLVYAENVNYGARRNLYGLKRYGMANCVISSAIILLTNDMIHYSRDIDLGRLLEMSPIAKVSMLMCFILFIVWIKVITTSWVYLAAKAYATSLVQAIYIVCGKK